MSSLPNLRLYTLACMVSVKREERENGRVAPIFPLVHFPHAFFSPSLRVIVPAMQASRH